jgi:ribosome-associated heat shock protein Hsp15
MRIDKFLWAVRIFKTRSMATDACKKGKIVIEEISVKPSRIVKKGETVFVKKGAIQYKFRIIEPIENRIGAKLVPNYIEDLTPPEELAKLQVDKYAGFFDRDRGTGRPTKKDRRDMDQFFDDNDEEEEEEG